MYSKRYCISTKLNSLSSIFHKFIHEYWSILLYIINNKIVECFWCVLKFVWGKEREVKWLENGKFRELSYNSNFHIIRCKLTKLYFCLRSLSEFEVKLWHLRKRNWWNAQPPRSAIIFPEFVPYVGCTLNRDTYNFDESGSTDETN